MDHEQAKLRAIALWQLATALRSNRDDQLWAIGEACDAQAIRFAKIAGIQYNDVSDQVDETPVDLSALTD